MNEQAYFEQFRGDSDRYATLIVNEELIEWWQKEYCSGLNLVPARLDIEHWIAKTDNGVFMALPIRERQGWVRMFPQWESHAFFSIPAYFIEWL